MKETPKRTTIVSLLDSHFHPHSHTHTTQRCPLHDPVEWLAHDHIFP